MPVPFHYSQHVQKVGSFQISYRHVAYDWKNIFFQHGLESADGLRFDLCTVYFHPRQRDGFKGILCAFRSLCLFPAPDLSGVEPRRFVCPGFIASSSGLFQRYGRIPAEREKPFLAVVLAVFQLATSENLMSDFSRQLLYKKLFNFILNYRMRMI
jgi:hypothetical protein